MKSRSSVNRTRTIVQIGSAIGALALVTSVGTAVSSGAATHSSSAVATSQLASRVAVKKVAFKGTYSGTLTFLLTSVASQSTSANVTSVTGRGTSTDLGATTLSGSGNVPATAASSGFHYTGSGRLAGPGGTLTLRILSKNSSGAAPENAAGTVTLTGTATVISGTGKLKGATGSLKFSGSFPIANDGVSGTQSPAFTSKLSGTLTIR
ncbi:MAG: hypothetical protein ABSC34_02740 [Acidimicrobiales bacterium]|jgi:hypothetical protein